MYLGIDTATPFLALALCSEAGSQISYERQLGREHGSHIMAALAQLFADMDAQPADVKSIGVGLGPGSYTGVRVGVATALGLARGWGCPVVGTSTLAALAARYVEQHPITHQVTAVLDARRGNVYAATFTVHQVILTSDPADANMPSPDNMPITNDVSNLQLDLQGEIHKVHRHNLTGEIAEGLAPSAMYLAQYACQHKDDAARLEPYYL